MDRERERFVELVLCNKVNQAVLERSPDLGVPDWWLVAGAVFQTVWNMLDGRDPAAGIRDYDVFYFDPTDLSWEAEDAVVRRAATLFADLDGVVEVRNEARVHLWYEDHFGVPAAAFRSSKDAIATSRPPLAATPLLVTRAGASRSTPRTATPTCSRNGCVPIRYSRRERSTNAKPRDGYASGHS